MNIKVKRDVHLCLAILLVPFFLLWMARGYTQDVSPTDDIIVKSVNAEMFQVKANMKLTDDQLARVQSILTDTTVKVRSLQLSLQNGIIDGKTMYDQRQKLFNDQNDALSRILSPDQMKVWANMQNYQ